MLDSELVTTDLAKFGHVQWREAGRILLTMAEQRGPWDRVDDPMGIYFNMDFGMVFLSDSEGQMVYVLDNDELKEWRYCPVCSEDGTKEDLAEGDDCCRAVADGTFWD